MISEQRKGEIALAFFKHRIQKEGIRIGEHTRREIGNVAREINIPIEEAIEFVGEITYELVSKTFQKKQSVKT